jgi:uncharacterized coiled-coil protein SlyX
MGQRWIDDQTTLAHIAPEIIEQETRIAQQRQLIEQLNATGHQERAAGAGHLLDDMCDRLARMRRDERAAKIALRERSFDRCSDEQAMEHVMRECPL